MTCPVDSSVCKWYDVTPFARPSPSLRAEKCIPALASTYPRILPLVSISSRFLFIPASIGETRAIRTVTLTNSNIIDPISKDPSAPAPPIISLLGSSDPSPPSLSSSLDCSSCPSSEESDSSAKKGSPPSFVPIDSSESGLIIQVPAKIEATARTLRILTARTPSIVLRIPQSRMTALVRRFDNSQCP